VASAVTVAAQINRLKSRFGERAFDDEFCKLVFPEMMGISEHSVHRMVDVFIGNRPANRPPMLVDFREFRLAEQKASFDSTVKAAARGMNAQSSGGLKAYLAKEFPGCKTLDEAIQVRRLQIQIAKAENPKYNPMADRKWMGEHAWPDDNGAA
jgi:hypothetical protein